MSGDITTSGPDPLSIAGQMRHELHGEVPENESADFAAFPGVPDGGERERVVHSLQDWGRDKLNNGRLLRQFI